MAHASVRVLLGLPVNMTNEEQLRASVSIAGIVNRCGNGKKL